MSLFYRSTRDDSVRVTASQAILKGLAPDGGLFVPESIPSLDKSLEELSKMSYKEVAYEVMKLMLDDFTEEELKNCIDKAYDSKFDTEEIAPLVKAEGAYFLELFHGATIAFKDMALSILPHLLTTSAKKNDVKNEIVILTATSGDTGKAALSGFCDVENIGINVFYPYKKVSAIQYRQMVTQKGNNVNVFGIQGNFDDAQSQVKRLFLDEELNAYCAKQNILLTSANSINVGRLVPQIVYYFDSYKQLVHQGTIKLGDKVSFSVPTGNFGDVLAGYYAYLMGLPVEKFYVASNANRVLTDFLTTGIYDRNRDFIQTISPSMDILISSNLERLLYYASNKDTQKVSKWMQELNEKGRYQIDDETFKTIQNLFACGSVDDESTSLEIKSVYDKTNYVLDPHSAIAYKVAKECKDRPIVSLATASPYKFSQDVLKALGYTENNEWMAMQDLSKYCQDAIPTQLKELQDLDVLHDRVIDVASMKDVVCESTKEVFHD